MRGRLSLAAAIHPDFQLQTRTLTLAAGSRVLIVEADINRVLLAMVAASAGALAVVPTNDPNVTVGSFLTTNMMDFMLVFSQVGVITQSAWYGLNVGVGTPVTVVEEFHRPIFRGGE